MSDFTTIIARLKLCDDEITQLKQRHEDPPMTIDGDGDNLPMSYHEPISMQSSSNSSGTAENVFRIRKTVVVVGSRNDETNSAGESQAVKDVKTVADAVYAYYNNHRRLHTAALGNLAGLWRDVDFEIQTGDVVSDGTGYLGFFVMFTVYTRSAIARNFGG